MSILVAKAGDSLLISDNKVVHINLKFLWIRIVGSFGLFGLFKYLCLPSYFLSNKSFIYSSTEDCNSCIPIKINGFPYLTAFIKGPFCHWIKSSFLSLDTFGFPIKSSTLLLLVQYTIYMVSSIFSFLPISEIANEVFICE